MVETTWLRRCPNPHAARHHTLLNDVGSSSTRRGSRRGRSRSCPCSRRASRVARLVVRTRDRTSVPLHEPVRRFLLARSAQCRRHPLTSWPVKETEAVPHHRQVHGLSPLARADAALRQPRTRARQAPRVVRHATPRLLLLEEPCSTNHRLVSAELRRVSSQRDQREIGHSATWAAV